MKNVKTPQCEQPHQLVVENKGPAGKAKRKLLDKSKSFTPPNPHHHTINTKCNTISCVNLQIHPMSQAFSCTCIFLYSCVGWPLSKLPAPAVVYSITQGWLQTGATNNTNVALHTSKPQLGPQGGRSTTAAA